MARRKHKEAAEDLLQAAQEEVARGLASVVVTPAAEVRRTVVITPQRPQGESAHFALVEASQLVPSHRPGDFRPDPMYPRIQERTYHSDVAEQLKVRTGAQRLRPELLLARTPSPLDGPPLVTEGPPYLVLGGNGRSMMLVLAYQQFPDSAGAYKAALAEQASSFGFTRQDVERMAAPVLVRVIEELNRDSAQADLVAAVRRYNEGMTQRMDPIARAVSQSRALSPESVRALGMQLAGGEASLRELMRESPAPVIRVLEQDGIITNQNRSEWVAGGGLTDHAKDSLEGMFLGLVLATPDRVRATAPGLLQKVERAVPHLVTVRATLPEAFDLVPAFTRAIDTLNEARVRGVSLEQLAAQRGLFGEGPELDSTSLSLARLLQESGPRQVGEAFRRWAVAANHDPAQSLMFGEPPTPERALSVLLGRQANPRKAVQLVNCTRCSGSGRVSPWAGVINWCPVCHGEGRIPAGKTDTLPGQLRLLNPSKRKGSRRRGAAPEGGEVPTSFATSAEDTRGIARELVQLYGGVGFPPEVEVLTKRKKRLRLTFDGKELAGLTFKGKRDPELLEALRADLARRRPLV